PSASSNRTSNMPTDRPTFRKRCIAPNDATASYEGGWGGPESASTGSSSTSAAGGGRTGVVGSVGKASSGKSFGEQGTPADGSSEDGAPAGRAGGRGAARAPTGGNAADAASPPFPSESTTSPANPSAITPISTAASSRTRSSVDTSYIAAESFCPSSLRAHAS